MKIILTITISKTNRSYDIKVDRDQLIQVTLKILKENLIPDLDDPSEIMYVQSMRTKRRISTKLTYEQAGIFEGENIII